MADLTLNIVSNMSGATAQVNEFTNAMRRATSAVSATGASVKKTGGEVSTAASHIAKLGRSANKTAGFFGKLSRSLARIAVYRVIRKAISYVGEAFKKGLEAAYAFSKASQPAEYAKLAGAMDGLKKAATTMSLQLGAAFGGLITAIAPVLIQIINLVTDASDAITSIKAELNGSGYYKKASEGFDDLGEHAGGAGKKIKGLLASWDELNVIGKESGGGGGGKSETDYSGAYEWVEAESDWAELLQNGEFFKIGEKLAGLVNGWIDSFDPVEWANKFSTWIKGALDLAIGFLVDLDAEELGEKIGEWIANVDWDGIAERIGALLLIAIEKSLEFVGGLTGVLLEKLFEPLTTGAESVGEKIKDFGDKFDEWYSGIIERIKEKFGGKTFLEWLFSPIADWAEGIGKSLKEFGDNFDNWYAALWIRVEDGFNIAIAWVKDLPTKAANLGIKIINALVDKIVGGLNALIEKYNGSFLAELFGEIEPLTFELLPEIPQEKLTKNVDEARRLAEQHANEHPLEWGATVTPELKLTTEYMNALDEMVDPRLLPVEVEATANYVGWKIHGTKAKSEIDKFTTWASTANWKNQKTDPDWAGTTWPSTANWKYQKTDPKWAGTTWGATANWKYQKTDTKWAGTTWPSTANWKYQKTDPKWAGTTWPSTAKWTKQVVGSSWTTPVLNASANFSTYKVDNAIKGSNQPSINVTANITKWTGDKTVKVTAEAKANGGVYRNGGWHGITSYASGGSPFGGQIFRARENGNPELVGTIRGSTAVMNNGQIVASVSDGVARAIAGIHFKMVGYNGATINNAVLDNEQIARNIQDGIERGNEEQNNLIREQNAILLQLLRNGIPITPSVSLGQVMARSADLYARA